MCFCFENFELKRLFSFLLINRPKDAREAHVGPGAFYVDNVSGRTEVCIFSLHENYDSVRKLIRNGLRRSLENVDDGNKSVA